MLVSEGGHTAENVGQHLHLSLLALFTSVSSPLIKLHISHSHQHCKIKAERWQVCSLSLPPSFLEGLLRIYRIKGKIVFGFHTAAVSLLCLLPCPFSFLCSTFFLSSSCLGSLSLADVRTGIKFMSKVCVSMHVF